jgi:hypothetical protein
MILLSNADIDAGRYIVMIAKKPWEMETKRQRII